MPLPETNNKPGGTPRRLRWWLWALGLIVVAPTVVTLFGAATSPPRVAHAPVGRILYLDADQPSERTTMLRGLYLTQTSGPSRLLIHELEPQDTDSGVREWITEPAASPDGKQVAYVKQDITLLEERRSINNQIWVMPLDAPNAKPRLLLDLTQKKLKQIVGLTWTPDSRSVVFLQDGVMDTVPIQGNAVPTELPIPGVLPLKIRPDISATANPTLAASNALDYTAVTPQGVTLSINRSTHQAVASAQYPGVMIYADSPDGRTVAFVPAAMTDTIRVSAITLSNTTDIKAHWGWSVFGKRHITALRWSPDGRYIAYTVSKPPIPEDELFYVDLATKKTYQLPIRTGQAAWDWTP